MSAKSIHDGGCYIVTMRGGSIIAGTVRIEVTGGVCRFVFDVPHADGRPGFLAILTDDGIIDARPCTAEEARAVMAGMRKRSLSVSEMVPTRPDPSSQPGNI